MEEGPPGLKRRTPISVDPADDAPPPETAPKPPAAPRKRRASIAPVVIAWGIPVALALGAVSSVVYWGRIDPPVRDESPPIQATQAPQTQSGAAGSSTAASGLNPPGCGVGTDAALAQAQATQGGSGDAAPIPEGVGSSGDSPPDTPWSSDADGAAADSPDLIPSPSPAPSPGGPAPAPGGSAPSLGGSWPRYRGADFSNISKEPGPYAVSWPAGGPKQLWSVQLGEGYAGAAISRGRVYVLDYDHAAQADTLRCLNLSDGKELWSQGYPVVVKRNHGMSRTVPAVSGKYVVTLGPKCHVMCADADNGAVYWRKDLVKEYGTKVPTWYAGQCPLIDGGKAIIAPGGKALMIAVDLASGEVVWKTPNPNNWKMTHSSIVPTTYKGTKMYLYCADGGVVGVSAKDGSILWSTSEWTVSTANIPVPIPIGDGRIFLCGGYNAGAMMLKLGGKGPRFTPEVLYRLSARVFGSDQQSPILYQDHIYGVIPGGQLACIDLQGKQLWTSGSTVRFGLGPYMMAGSLMYVLSETGELALVQPNPSKYNELARAKVLNGHDAWGPLAVASGRLLARDLKTMVCLDVSGS